MIDKPDQVRAWAAQFAAGDFPPVCAMSGEPATSSHRFVLASAVDWVAAVLLVAAIRIPGWRPHIAIGRLPLTEASRKVVSRAEAGRRALVVLAIMLLCGGIALAVSTTDLDLSSIARTLISLGVVVGLLFIPASLLSKNALPHGKVLDPPVGYSDRIVELRRVHPNFVSAVKQHQLARASQVGPTELPLPSGSK